MLAENNPNSPPAGSVSAMGCQPLSMPSAVQVAPVHRKAPMTLIHGASIGDDRTHFQPSIRISTGSVKAAKPKACSIRSDIHAPNAPIMLMGEAPLATVFQERSMG